MITLVDETGLNPLPAGIRVTLYEPSALNLNAAGLASLLGAPLAQAYTTAGGLCNLTVNTAVQYVALFDMSGQAPLVPCYFVGGPSLADTTTVTVPGYRSPVLSSAGYAQAQAAQLPKLWFPKAAQSGSNMNNVLLILGAMLAQADTFGELIHSALRLTSSAGSQIDTWARDFFGPYLPRLQGESDSSYVARIFVALQAPKTTLQEIQAMVIGFYAALAGQSGFGAGQSQALDLAGALDVQGGLDANVPFQAQGDMPYIFVWDRQSNPGLAAAYDVNPNNDDGSFVIQVGIANTTGWNLDYSFLDDNTYLIDPNQYTLSNTPPDARLGALVNFVKAAGTWPRYLTADLT